MNVSATAPTLPADPTAPRVDTIVSGDANTVAFLDCANRLDTLIRTQAKSLLTYFIARGGACADGIDVKLAKGTNKATRDALRAAAIRALDAVANAAYDPTDEPAPKIDRWISLHWLPKHFPGAVKLPSVGVAEVFATDLTRVEPPAAWNAPETCELKRKYAPAALAETIDRASREGMTIEAARDALDRIGGLVEPDAPAGKTDDPVKAARTLAASIMERITDRKIDPETFFDELQSQLRKYGWTLARGRDGKGGETLKPMKTAR